MAERATWARYRALGSGRKTRDGCSVDLYLKLPYCEEVELLRRWLKPGTEILELGSGVGRVTRKLLADGYRVTAVDNSPDMLAHVPREAETICCDIERLDLGRKFDVVLYGSCLINVPDAALRSAQLSACNRHLKSGGWLLFERYDPDWLSIVSPGRLGRLGDVDMAVEHVERRGDQIDLCFRYGTAGESWHQFFPAQVLSARAISACLDAAGFGAPDWINRTWGAATSSIVKYPP